MSRIIHLHFGKDGGAERFFVNLAQSMASRGIEQKFIIRPDREWKPKIENLGEVIENHFRLATLSGQLLRWRMGRLTKTWQPDAVMAWMPRASKLLPSGVAAVRLTRLGDYPKSLKSFKNSDFLVANTPGIASRCRELGWSKPVHVISNFARQIEVHPVDRKTFGTPEKAFLVATSGRLVPRKGMDCVLRAVAMIPDAWLWIAGAGQEEESLKQLTLSLGIANRTRFLGWLEEPMHVVAAADAYLMASRHEPLGNVILEAWHAGVPVVCTRSEGPNWFATDGHDALMVEIDSIQQMASALQRLRDDPTLSDKLRAGGKDTLNNHFSRDGITDKYLSLLKFDR